VTITPTNERYVYDVVSERPPHNKYRVDLVAEGGYSWCSCRDWQTRRGPAIKRGDPVGSPSTVCRHTKEARFYFLNTLLSRLATEENEHNQP